MSDPDYYYRTRIAELLSTLSMEELPRTFEVVKLLVLNQEDGNLIGDTLNFINERLDKNAKKHNK